MPDAELCILSTRLLAQPLIDKALAHGIRVDAVPFIDISFIEAEILQAQIQSILTQSATVVFTSSNAVKSVARFLNGTKPDWKIYCLSTATKDSVVAAFGEQSIMATADDGTALAQLIIANVSVDKVVFFCGNLRRNIIPDVLQQHGKSVTEILAYHTVATPQNIHQTYNGVVFFSPSAVDSFFSVNIIPEETICYAIGKTTADSIKKRVPQNPLQTSVTPSGEAITDLIINTLHA
ncbi:uroporphyrinogen-III synthase [Taibaiella soli]|uniref:Tetrapyrrole biosynthesis uroporphyrinogen III synthase domain-containing protein n=1 Tax=Taibaiella soli TaxID=1649169 RepID=A0A2W2B3P2_9BACT|nr:uroporphyrinogen-III synthase [Taibaiella soli]PZF70807.1 hypothetical protein DN068_21425 [Taibaiella soli]